MVPQLDFAVDDCLVLSTAPSVDFKVAGCRAKAKARANAASGAAVDATDAATAAVDDAEPDWQTPEECFEVSHLKSSTLSKKKKKKKLWSRRKRERERERRRERESL